MWCKRADKPGELQLGRRTGKLSRNPGQWRRDLRDLPGARAMRNSRTLGQVDLNVLDSSKRFITGR
ncbi:hypothetical protein SAJA_14195 [Salinisphaera japonica YTM-1]|uniref:Uncharacterized protein n=1 Tax=Salinisphaera japonica YTM-1 TaxID=1209778 RepID=A0A423PFI8_9GAMM|nr:hypothetical protein SAJA_14195 [Salinisphaera japonica YTM-1]